ncbi:MAG TPA: glycine--tRNA ligase [Alphaproteobacteria bacterium]|jgi:glycyl-tRNA synthetase|nr:glycine--tRNA ligase [Alphaproteobacteria bacterium]
MELMEKIVALAKRRGFVFPTSEIYGGLSNSYDYGPAGAELLRNIRNLWWKEFINNRDDMVGLDTQILLRPETWVASGHVAGFNEPMVEDKVTQKRYRADHLIEKWLPSDSKIIVEDMTMEEMDEFIKKNKILSPEGNELTEIKKFNQLFETAIGAVSGEKSKVYLRGETAQGIFTDFKQVLDSSRVKLPFGIGNIGKSFRNEITTGQFVFRTLEFEQAEIEYFFDPEASKWEDIFDDFKSSMFNFVTKTLGVKEENLRWRRHTDKERSFYSKETYDLDYKFPFGFKELWGIAYRTDYDLKQHMEHSGQSLEYVDPSTSRKFIPHVIEPAVGINRIFLMLLADAYAEDPSDASGQARIVLKLNPKIAPYKIAVFPLLANKPELVEKARSLYSVLRTNFSCTWDARGNIGKRYFAQDEIGTPWCVTVDFDTLEDNTVTVRDRDSAKQERISIDKLEDYFQNRLK